MNELNRMRAFNSVALVGSGVLFALTGFVPKEMPFLAVILITLNFAVVSTNCGGFYVCQVDQSVGKSAELANKFQAVKPTFMIYHRHQQIMMLIDVIEKLNDI
ncbi:hypothetical protein niasHT_012042 [Heterodera trifolii]|uniref:DUF2892 domain-containing protein n=1 Tax=Heterodera trifolii TaxID=157864 RepID=A0ABD2KVH6_9BILA